jgi:dienelactone hydrolase
MAVAVTAAMALTLPAAPAYPVAGSMPDRPVLPRPTGRHELGVTELHLVDDDRSDPWHPERSRELMVSVWYPAERRHRRGPAAPWLSPGVVPTVEAQAEPVGIPVGSLDWAGIRTHARAGAPAARPAAGGRPVVLYSPGLGGLRSFGTVVVEELASRGYVVVTIDHTYETVVEMPGGRVTQPVDVPPTPATLQVTLDARVADTRYVLDQLARLDRGDNPDAERRRLPAGLRGSLDLRRVGMFGHSFGGFTAGETMVGDRRLDAGVNLDGSMAVANGLDGWPYEPSRVAAEGLDRPFLLMGSEIVDPATGETLPHDHLGFDRSWQDFWAHQRGWKRDLLLTTAGHNSYSDLQAVLPQAPAVPAEARQALIGTIDPGRSIAAQRAYVTAFFDLHLRGDHDARRLFAGPSPRHPEVRFVE